MVVKVRAKRAFGPRCGTRTHVETPVSGIALCTGSELEACFSLTACSLSLAGQEASEVVQGLFVQATTLCLAFFPWARFSTACAGTA